MHFVRSLTLVLLGLSLLIVLPATGLAQEADTTAAIEALAEFEAVCERAEALWPVELCGPVVLVHPGTRLAVANRPDAEGRFRPFGGAFVGEWPADEPVANTGIDWGGTRWAMVMLPLTAEAFDRYRLLAHESFHRIQPALGHDLADATLAHLEEEEGRVWLRLEVRAFARALATEGDASREAVFDALLFRRVRNAAFPGSAELERRLEGQEGLAEYTGVRFALDVMEATWDAAARRVEAFERRPTYARSLGYGTGPALGLLLDRYDPGWRESVGSSPNLAHRLAVALGAPEADPDAAPRRALAERRAAAYGYDAIRAEEAERAERLAAERARYQEALVEGPVLVVDLPDMLLLFNPNLVLPLGEHGHVYPNAILMGPWGRLTLSEGGALAPAARDRARVRAPESVERDDDGVVHGPGWTLELETGWRIVPGERAGDYRLAAPGPDSSRMPEPGAGLTVTPEEAAAVDAVFAEWSGPSGPGAAVAVTRDGALVYAEGYGSAQLEYGVPITSETVFHVASVSKQFTAFAVALLAREGRLSWDDDVRVHLPELPELGHPLTLRQLANHTSGVRDQWQLLVMAGWRMDDVITRDQILRMMARQRELNFEPGTAHLYSNMGYTLLAEVVERVSGQGFGEFLEARVFGPLGMRRTHVHDDHTRIVPGRAYSYAPVEGGWRKAPLNYANQGATSLFTTVEDLARWIGEYEDPSLGDPALWAEMRERAVLADGDTVPYALGLQLGEYRGLRTVGHGGSDAGFRTHLLHFPAERLGVVVFGNSSAFRAAEAARSVAEVFLEDRMKPSAEVASEPAPRESEGAREDVALGAAELEAYVGTYYSPELDTFYRIRVGEAGLVMEHPRHPPAELTPRGEDRFEGSAWQMRDFVFSRAEDGEVDGFRVSGGRVLELRFERVAAPTVTREDARDRLDRRQAEIFEAMSRRDAEAVASYFADDAG